MEALHWGDFLALGLYFVIVIGIGIWSSCQNRGSADGYFVARRSMGFIPVISQFSFPFVRIAFNNILNIIQDRCIIVCQQYR